MALFHLSVTQTKRSAGQSAIASAAYRAGERLMLSRLVDTFFSRTSWTMLLYAENHSISVA